VHKTKKEKRKILGEKNTEKVREDSWRCMKKMTTKDGKGEMKGME
jgi:hypothetical protein